MQTTFQKNLKTRAKYYSIYLWLGFLFFSCCEDALFTEAEQAFIPQKKSIEQMIFKFQSSYDTLVLTQHYNEKHPCHPIKVSKYNTESFSYGWENKKQQFVSILQIEKESNEQAIPVLSLYDLDCQLTNKYLRSNGIYLCNSKNKNATLTKKLKSFTWSKDYGFLQYTDEDGQVWKRINLPE